MNTFFSVERIGSWGKRFTVELNELFYQKNERQKITTDYVEVDEREYLANGITIMT